MHALISMLESFGFDPWPSRKGEELVLRRRLRPSNQDRLLDAAEFHRRFGPHYVKPEGVATFVIPVQPRFHELLFPETEPQLSLTAGMQPFGNAIRKAYLCRAKVRRIKPGSVLLFYRSHEGREVRVVGVAESTLVSGDAQRLARFVGTRTVYSQRDIERMADGDVLAILFRQARLLRPPLSYDEMLRLRFLRGPPQSIVRVPDYAQPGIAKLLEWPDGVSPSE